jgi:cytochrome P450
MREFSMTTRNQRIEKDGKGFLDYKRDSDPHSFPDEFAKYLMSHGDIYYWLPSNVHVVTHADIAKEVLTSTDFSADRSSFFISRMPELDLSLIGDFFSIVKNMMVMNDGEIHQKMRKSALNGLEDHILAAFKSKLDDTVHNLVDQALDKDQFDFYKDIAAKLPSIILADLFGIPSKDRLSFYNWAINMTAFFGGATKYQNSEGIKVNQSAIALRDYFSQLIKLRKDNPGQDFISLMLKHQKTYNLSDQEILSQAIMMLVAGQVTTTDQLCNIFYLIISNSKILSELQSQPKLIPAAVEECKRYDPAVTFLFRVAKKDLILGPQPILKGETVFIANHAVNRNQFDTPTFELNIQRDQIKHFAYGYGPHYCLGANLGRLQINSLFNYLITRNKDLKFVSPEGIERDHYALSFSGFKKMRVAVRTNS